MIVPDMEKRQRPKRNIDQVKVRSWQDGRIKNTSIS